MVKSTHNRAWFFVVPALLLLGFVAVIPILMVMKYSFYDIFTLESKVWVGLEWYREILGSRRFWETFGRSLLFSAIILSIEMVHIEGKRVFYFHTLLKSNGFLILNKNLRFSSYDFFV